MKIVHKSEDKSTEELREGMLVTYRNISPLVFLLLERTKIGHFSYVDLQTGIYHKEGLFTDYIPYKGTVTISN